MKFDSFAVYDRSSFIFRLLYCGYSGFSVSFECSLYWLWFLGSLLNIRYLDKWIHVCDIYIASLIYKPLSVLVLCFLYWYSSVMFLEICNDILSSTVLLAQAYFGYLWLCWFHIHFRIDVYLCEGWFWGFHWNSIESVCGFWWNGHILNVNSTTDFRVTLTI